MNKKYIELNPKVESNTKRLFIEFRSGVDVVDTHEFQYNGTLSVGSDEFPVKCEFDHGLGFSPTLLPGDVMSIFIACCSFLDEMDRSLATEGYNILNNMIPRRKNKK